MSTAPSLARRTHRRRPLVIALVVVVLLLGTAVVGTEAYARHRISQCISSQFEREMGSTIDVSFGPKPLLLTYIDGKVPEVTVDSNDNRFGPAEGMIVHATFTDVVLNDDGGGSVGASSADVTWSNEGIAQTLTGMVSGVKSAASSGTVTMDVLGGLAQLEVRPQVRGDRVVVDTTGAQFLGIGLPTDLVQGIVDLFTESLQAFPIGMRADRIAVTDSGIDVHLTGGHFDLAANSQNSDQEVRC
ncbi:LmeA family phospholipid-binding protein [Nocardia harenae]|uniref:LmeA family phospholipid-binding protein n=1 Tax=Nocardia harenae TaxID=358707 RepID=UPI0009FFB427|nr:DUF2993 domain-containing protein [Nocardia harenae]